MALLYDLDDETAAIGIAGSIFLLVTAGIVIVGLTYYGGDMLQRAQTDTRIGQHARQVSTFSAAVKEFVHAKGDGLSNGRHVYKASDLKSLGFLNQSFNETTPWGETFVAYLYKDGDEVSGVISEYGDPDKKALKTVVDEVTDETLRALKLRVAQKRVRVNPTSSDVPGVGKDGVADGVKGMYEDVAIDTYVVDDTYRYVGLMDVEGLGNVGGFNVTPTLEETLEQDNRAGDYHINLEGKSARNPCHVGLQIYFRDIKNRSMKSGRVYTRHRWSEYGFARIRGQDNPVVDVRARIYLSDPCPDVHRVGIQTYIRDTVNRTDYGSDRYSYGGWSNWSKATVAADDNPLEHIYLRVYMDGDPTLGVQTFIEDTKKRVDMGGQKKTGNGWSAWSKTYVYGGDNPLINFRGRVYFQP